MCPGEELGCFRGTGDVRAVDDGIHSSQRIDQTTTGLKICSGDLDTGRRDPRRVSGDGHHIVAPACGFGHDMTAADAGGPQDSNPHIVTMSDSLGCCRGRLYGGQRVAHISAPEVRVAGPRSVTVSNESMPTWNVSPSRARPIPKPPSSRFLFSATWVTQEVLLR